MLARTHGQEASPTTVGKEMAIFAARLYAPALAASPPGIPRQAQRRGRQFQRASTSRIPRSTGSRIRRISSSGFGLAWNPLTTQIESHDFIAELFGVADAHRHDPARLLPRHVELHLDRLLRAEGGRGRDRLLGDAAQGQSDRLRELRGQPRDRQRAVRSSGGQAAGLAMAARSDGQHGDRDRSAPRSGIWSSRWRRWSAALRASRSTSAESRRISSAEQAWEVVAEAIQTLMRRHGLPQPYETLKELTRGRRIDRRAIEEFIATLPLDAASQAALRELESAQLRRTGGEAGRALRAGRKSVGPSGGETTARSETLRPSIHTRARRFVDNRRRLRCDAVTAR